MHNTSRYPFLYRSTLKLSAGILLSFLFVFVSCKTKKPPEKEIVNVPEKMDVTVQEVIRKNMSYAESNDGKLSDSLKLYYVDLVAKVYDEYSDDPRWCKKEEWLPQADSLFKFISQSRLFGLFPTDYHFNELTRLRNRVAMDTMDRKDAALWARGDILLTDAMLRIVNHVKLGRLPNDSISQRKDSVLKDEYYLEKFRAVVSGNPIKGVIESMEPLHQGYWKLKEGISRFLDSADFRDLTIIPYPEKDTTRLKMLLVKRLKEGRLLDSAIQSPDSMQLGEAILKFQKARGLKADGKIGPQTISELNLTDNEKFLRIAITLDRYKMLPEKMPEKYVWVNIPSYQLKLVDKDTIRIQSKIVVGKPHTRTPVLNSSIYEMITYPQWTIPQSIIMKEILPELKKDPGYLFTKGYSLVRDTGVIDPYTVDWTVYTKGIPYKVVQGSGDDNALGIMKFNFGNKYAVYMHDTNQRFYFSRTSRALSHGCVRVQEWEKLSNYLLTNDSIQASMKRSKAFTPSDSVRRWLVQKEKKSIPVRNRIPVFIRYYTCEAVNGRINFYEDIYNEDKMLRDYFISKS